MNELNFAESPQYHTLRRDLERRIRQFVSLGSGIAADLVIPGYDDGPLPIELYASVTHIETVRTGTPHEGYDSGMLSQRSAHTGMYSVQWYRAGAAAAADRFWAWAESPFGSMHGTRLGMRFQGIRRVRNVAEIITDSFEERVSAEVKFGYFQHVTYQAGRIQSVEVEVAQDGVTDPDNPITIDVS